MATLKATVKAFLEADATLVAAAPGGIFDETEFSNEGLDLGAIRDATTLLIKPALVIRWRDSQRFGQYDPLPAARRFMEAYAYAHQGYVEITTILERLYDLLERKYFTSDDCGLAWFQWVGDLGEDEDDSFGGMLPMDRSRYSVILTRK